MSKFFAAFVLFLAIFSAPALAGEYNTPVPTSDNSALAEMLADTSAASCLFGTAGGGVCTTFEEAMIKDGLIDVSAKDCMLSMPVTDVTTFCLTAAGVERMIYPEGMNIVCEADKSDAMTQFDCVENIAVRIDKFQRLLKANHGVVGGEHNFFFVQAEMLRIKKALKSMLVLELLDPDVKTALGYQSATLANLDITMEAWYSMYVNPSINLAEEDCKKMQSQTCG
jgi:hypothetical protein